MELHPQEVAIQDSGQEPVILSEFRESRMVRPELVLEADFIVSRDWEPEETEEGVTINTTPNPTLKLFETRHGAVLVFCVKTPDPIVHTAVLAGHNDLEGMVRRAVESVEENFDGISDVSEGQSHKRTADSLLDHLYDCVLDVTPDEVAL